MVDLRGSSFPSDQGPSPTRRSGGGDASTQQRTAAPSAASSTTFVSFHASSDFQTFVARSEVPLPREHVPAPTGSARKSHGTIGVKSRPVRAVHPDRPHRDGSELLQPRTAVVGSARDGKRGHRRRRARSADPPATPAPQQVFVKDAMLHQVPLMASLDADIDGSGPLLSGGLLGEEASAQELQEYIEVLTVQLRSEQLLVENERGIRNDLEAQVDAKEHEVRARSGRDEGAGGGASCRVRPRR